MTTLKIQKAVYDKLSAEFPGKIYDRVDETAEYPYIVISDISSAESDTQTWHGAIATLTIHVFSSYKGNKELLEIFNRIYISLHMQQLQDAWSTVFDAENIVIDDDDIRHGVQRYIIRYEVKNV